MAFHPDCLLGHMLLLRSCTHERVNKRVSSTLEGFEAYHNIKRLFNCHSSFRYYSVSIFCKIGAPGYTASAVFGILTTLATLFAIFTIDKVIFNTQYVCTRNK